MTRPESHQGRSGMPLEEKGRWGGGGMLTRSGDSTQRALTGPDGYSYLPPKTGFLGTPELGTALGRGREFLEPLAQQSSANRSSSETPVLPQ